MAVSADFWATTAQVVPTHLLYVVERQYTKPTDSAPRSVGSVFVAFTVGLALMGEFLALRCAHPDTQSLAVAPYRADTVRRLSSPTKHHNGT
jgi:hypothetical protein